MMEPNIIPSQRISIKLNRYPNQPHHVDDDDPLRRHQLSYLNGDGSTPIWKGRGFSSFRAQIKDSGLTLGVDDETSPYLAVKVSCTRVECTSVHGILSWTVASNRTYSVLTGIFEGANEARSTTTLVFFRS